MCPIWLPQSSILAISSLSVFPTRSFKSTNYGSNLLRSIAAVVVAMLSRHSLVVVMRVSRATKRRVNSLRIVKVIVAVVGIPSRRWLIASNLPLISPSACKIMALNESVLSGVGNVMALSKVAACVMYSSWTRVVVGRATSCVVVKLAMTIASRLGPKFWGESKRRIGELIPKEVDAPPLGGLAFVPMLGGLDT